VREALDFFSKIPLRGNGRAGLDPEISRPILKEVTTGCAFSSTSARLPHARTLGGDALGVERPNGSASRRRSGSRLVGVLYILDEPSIGLHQRDNARLARDVEGAARTSATRAGRGARRGNDSGG